MFTSPLEFDIVLRAKNANDNLVSQLTITTPALATHHVAQNNGYGYTFCVGLQLICH